MAETKTKELSPDEVAAKRAALLEQLADLPPAPVPAGAQPGQIIGTGPQQEYVPFTADWFTDVEARRKDVDANGLPKWPNYQLHTIMATTNEVIRVNGVGFALYAGMECKLPSPHYAVYKDALDAPKRLEREFAPPEVPGSRAGYISPPHIMGTGPIRRADG